MKKFQVTITSATGTVLYQQTHEATGKAQVLRRLQTSGRVSRTTIYTIVAQ